MHAEHAGMKPLSKDFKPSDDDVICARGKEVYNHEGNRRFRTLVKTHLQTYSSCVTKIQKSRLVNFIVGSVRQASPNGGFVKRIGRRWFLVSDRHAREKCGQTMRDLLHSRYSSSTKAKARQRQLNREVQRGESDGFEDLATQARLARTGSQTLSSLRSLSQPLKIHRSQSSPVRRRTCIIGDRSKAVKEMISSMSSNLTHPEESTLTQPSFRFAHSISVLPMVSPTSSTVLASSANSMDRCTRDPFDDLFGRSDSNNTRQLPLQYPKGLFSSFFENESDSLSDDLSLTMDDLDDLQPLPLEESSHEFNFEHSASTQVSAESFSHAVDTLFECLHIGSRGSLTRCGAGRNKGL
ncbi:Nitrilase family, member 2 [Seminavis robusta]|uniref:Nitrilase family, member 2 n=1 Tax=Seminavis robusta TaxID=568900 RepID=A0A9N8DFR6_9STRA|nr:Nitrilase family, member 2 [Seminavis robusta]|eukprot:Sro97_g050090.1 Nitrilase family, member 2 (353) ;mRNA; f:89788-91158